MYSAEEMLAATTACQFRCRNELLKTSTNLGPPSSTRSDALKTAFRLRLRHVFNAKSRKAQHVILIWKSFQTSTSHLRRLHSTCCHIWNSSRSICRIKTRCAAFGHVTEGPPPSFSTLTS